MADVNPAKESDLKKLFLWIGTAFLLLSLLLILIGTISFDSFGDDSESNRGQGTSERNRYTHIISGVRPHKLTHWNDANRDGRVQRVERTLVTLPAGCYSFQASDTRTKLSHDGPTGPFHDLGSIMLLNGELRNEVVVLTEEGTLDISFYPFGSRQYPRVASETGFQLMHVSLYPATCPEGITLE